METIVTNAFQSVPTLLLVLLSPVMAIIIYKVLAIAERYNKRYHIVSLNATDNIYIHDEDYNALIV